MSKRQNNAFEKLNSEVAFLLNCSVHLNIFKTRQLTLKQSRWIIALRVRGKIHIFHFEEDWTLIRFLSVWHILMNQHIHNIAWYIERGTIGVSAKWWDKRNVNYILESPLLWKLVMKRVKRKNTVPEATGVTEVCCQSRAAGTKQCRGGKVFGREWGGGALFRHALLHHFHCKAKKRHFLLAFWITQYRCVGCRRVDVASCA